MRRFVVVLFTIQMSFIGQTDEQRLVYANSAIDKSEPVAHAITWTGLSIGFLEFKK